MMIDTLLRITLTSLLVGGLCQCAALKKKAAKNKEEPTAETKTRTLLVGTVELVNPEQRYVLIQRDPSMIIPAGTELSCLDATGTVSKIVTTPEQKGNFIAADIKEGTPRVKNLVLHVIHDSPEALTGFQPQPTATTLPPGFSPLPMNGPLDSGLPPLEQDMTVEPGSIPIPPGGIDLEPPSEAEIEPSSSSLPRVLE